MKILGCSGSKMDNKFPTTIQLNKRILIDAGNIMGLGKKAQYIDYIFLTHSHLDHILDIPFLIDNFFSIRKLPIFIFGLEETLMDLKKYIFNNQIWPDFNQIDLLNHQFKAIMFIPIEEDEVKIIDNITIRSIKSNHIIPTLGYVINEETIFSGDTYKNDVLKQELQNKNIKNLIIDVSFPSYLEELAKVSKHLTPTSLKEFLDEVNRKDLNVYIFHLKPQFEEDIKKELQKLNVTILKQGDII